MIPLLLLGNAKEGINCAYVGTFAEQESMMDRISNTVARFAGSGSNAVAQKTLAEFRNQSERIPLSRHFQPEGVSLGIDPAGLRAATNGLWPQHEQVVAEALSIMTGELNAGQGEPSTNLEERSVVVQLNRPSGSISRLSYKWDEDGRLKNLEIGDDRSVMVALDELNVNASASMRSDDVPPGGRGGMGMKQLRAQLQQKRRLSSDLSDSDLFGSDLSDADLSDADLSGSDLSDVDLFGKPSALIPAKRRNPTLNATKDIVDPNIRLVAATTGTIKKPDEISHEIMHAIGNSLKNNFDEALQAMLNAYLIQGPDLTLKQQQHNAFWSTWQLPLDVRVRAAAFQALYQSCKDQGVKINANNTEQLLTILTQLRNHGIDRNPNQGIDRDTTVGKFFNEKPTLQFKVSETTQLFENIVSGIEVLTGQAVDADQMWKHCVNPELVADVIAAGADPDNPFLRYIANSPGQPFLFYMAKGWQTTIDASRTTDPLSADFLIRLYAICTGAKVQKSAMKLDKNGNGCGLIVEGDMTPENMTPEKNKTLKPLMENLENFLKTHGIEVTCELDVETSEAYGKPAFDLIRLHVDPAKLKDVLDDFVYEHREEDKAISKGSQSAEEKAIARTMNDFDLARKLTQFRLLPKGNLLVGHFVLNLRRLQRGEGPASLFNHDDLDIKTNTELFEQFKAQAI